jgi:hypothetical protein
MLFIYNNYMGKNYQKILELINQMISYNMYMDIKENSQNIGENWNVFHLKMLKALIQDEEVK